MRIHVRSYVIAPEESLTNSIGNRVRQRFFRRNPVRSNMVLCLRLQNDVASIRITHITYWPTPRRNHWLGRGTCCASGLWHRRPCFAANIP